MARTIAAALPATEAGEPAPQSSSSTPAIVNESHDKMMKDVTDLKDGESENEPPAAEVVHEPGMECDVKNLYQKEDDRGRFTWTEKLPDDLEEAAENEITARYAILVRNKKSFDPRKKLEIDSIVIQSPLLKNVLSKVLKDYPGKSTYLGVKNTS
jgi:hypothetical protein